MKRTPRQKAMRTTRFRKRLNDKGHTRLEKYRSEAEPLGEHTYIACLDCSGSWRLYDTEPDDPTVWACHLHRARGRVMQEES